MVADYMRRFYGEEILASTTGSRRSCPCWPWAARFLVSHAEPADFFTCER